MRLLNVDSLIVEEFAGSEPPYAILSHTWEDEEVLYHDMLSSTARRKKGWAKVRNCCELAKSHGWRHVWIDTCCIDKTSSAELSEAINSMWKWYQQAGVCYAYLSDVPAGSRDHWSRNSAFQKSRWFTRGWTLQELLAPEHVYFYDAAWQEIGTRSALADEIEHVTGISDHDMANLGSISIAAKLCWASARQTTRPEDEAYCLMGLFNVNMPLLYGEGKAAFHRLQLEIMRTSTDESLFAWTVPGDRSDTYSGLLAPDPAAFTNMSDIVPLPRPWTRPEYMWTNKGLRVELDLYDYHSNSELLNNGFTSYLAPLPCAWIGDSDARVAIVLQEASGGAFTRHPHHPLVRWYGSKEAPSRRTLYLQQWEPWQQETTRFLISLDLGPEIVVEDNPRYSSLVPYDINRAEFLIYPFRYNFGLPLIVTLREKGKFQPDTVKLLYLGLIKRDHFLMMSLAERPDIDDWQEAENFKELVTGVLTRQQSRVIEQTSISFGSGHSISVLARPMPFDRHDPKMHNVHRKYKLEVKMLTGQQRARLGGGNQLLTDQVSVPSSARSYSTEALPQPSQIQTQSLLELLERRWSLVRNTSFAPFSALKCMRPFSLGFAIVRCSLQRPTRITWRLRYLQYELLHNRRVSVYKQAYDYLIARSRHWCIDLRGR